MKPIADTPPAGPNEHDRRRKQTRPYSDFRLPVEFVCEAISCLTKLSRLFAESLPRSACQLTFWAKLLSCQQRSCESYAGEIFMQEPKVRKIRSIYVN